MEFAKFVVSGIVPDIEHRRVHHVSEDFFGAVVQAAQGHIAVDQDGHGPPESIARFANPLLFGITQSTAPIVDMGKVDVIDDAIEHLFGLFSIGGLTSGCDDDRGLHLGLIAKFAEGFHIFDDFGVVQPDAKGVELLGVRAIDTDFDFV